MKGEAFLALLTRRIPAVLWAADRDLRVTRAEGAGLALLGLDPAALLGATAPACFGPCAPDSPPAAAHRDALAGRGGAFDAGWGGRAWRAAVDPLAAADGSVEGVIGVAVARSGAGDGAAERAHRMESVGRLAGGVAHDFNNVLTVITGYSDLLLVKLAEGDPNRRQISEIRKASEKATELTGQLMSLSRRQVMAPRLVDLRETLADAERKIRPLLGEEIRIALVPGDRPLPVRVDPVLFTQVIVNLAVRGGVAMPRGGTLRIEARREGGAPTGERAILEATDQGDPVDAEELEHFFEPFFSPKERGRGAGVGLAMVYGIVRQSGGELEVEPARPRGTVVRIRLPIAESAPASDPAPAPVPAPASSGKRVILVVEDEESIRELVVSTLAGAGYSVLTAGDGRGALERLDAPGGAVDLLLTDVVMPRMGGGELARAFRERRPGVRVLFMSGYTGDPAVRQWISDEGEAFLRKPFSPEELAAKVREMLGG